VRHAVHASRLDQELHGAEISVVQVEINFSLKACACCRCPAFTSDTAAAAIFYSASLCSLVSWWT